MSGYIYYIVCSETSRVKIGYTKGNPWKRLKALQTGSATELRVVAVHPGTPQDERDLHELYASERVRGEWFAVSERLFQHMGIVCWTVAKAAIEQDREPPEWAMVGAAALDEAYGYALPGETLQ